MELSLKEVLEEYKRVNKPIRDVSKEEQENSIVDSVTINKSDLKKLGKDLMKEVDKFLHDEYIIKTFPEIILDKKEYDRLVVNGTEDLTMDEIYHILVKIKLDNEINGDLYYKKNGYLNLYKVLYVDYTYL